MTDFPLFGTIVNTVAVLIGAASGLVIRRFAARCGGKEATVQEGRKGFSDALMRAMGLCVILIGIMGALSISNVLLMIVSMALGTVLGELLDLDGWVNRLGKWVEARLGGGQGRITEGFVSTTLLFCVGAMTVTGAIESGIAHTHTTYYAKSLIDMVSATIFATTLGGGVLLSAASVFLIQGGLTLVAVWVGGAIPTLVVGEIMAVGSLLVIGIGTNLLGITKLKVMNMLPAMFLPPVLCPVFSFLPL